MIVLEIIVEVLFELIIESSGKVLKTIAHWVRLRKENTFLQILKKTGTNKSR